MVRPGPRTPPHNLTLIAASYGKHLPSATQICTRGIYQTLTQVLVLGAGFAGYHCLRRLERRLSAGAAEVIAVNPEDYMLYVPLLPDVTGGVLEPHRVAVPLRARLPRSRLVLGNVTSLNLDEQTCSVADIEGRGRVRYDRLVIACGGVTRLLAVPGVAEHALGFKSVAEALYLRDHILRQLELAEQCDDDDERTARLTFVVVGAGYTGTEVAAQGALLTSRALRRRPELRGHQARWVLLDLASRVLPGLSAELSGPAASVLRRRGVDVRLGQTVTEVASDCTVLSDGAKLPAYTAVWCVGVRPDSQGQIPAGSVSIPAYRSGRTCESWRTTRMLPVSLIFTSGAASGVNCYAAVLVLGLLGRFGHIAAIPQVLERPQVLAAAAVLFAGQFVVGKVPVLDSVWDVAHTALRPVVGGAVGVVMAQHAQASSAAVIAAAALGGGTALAAHVVKSGVRVGVNASPEPFSNIVASLLEDAGVVGLVSFAVFHPVPAAIIAAVALAAGIAAFALLAARIRRAWRRRREARLQRSVAPVRALRW